MRRDAIGVRGSVERERDAVIRCEGTVQHHPRFA